MLKRILVVDDEEAIRHMLVAVLTNMGFAVATAVDGSAALNKIHSGYAPDLILLDVMMPVMGAKEFLIRLRREFGASIAHPNPDEFGIPKIIIVSAYLQKDPQAFLNDFGAAALITKPFTLRELQDVIRHVL